MKYSIFIYRRDLRIDDNIALYHSIFTKKITNIIPIFIFTPEQTKKNENKYRSTNSIRFMIQSLQDLNNEFKKYNSQLHFFYGKNINILDKISKKIKIENIIFNKDYTPYARERDIQIQNFCKNNKIKCHIYEDYLLQPMGTFLRNNQEIYKVYTAFRNNILKMKIKIKPLKYTVSKSKKNIFIKYNNFDSNIDIVDFYNILDVSINLREHNKLIGGRRLALIQLKKFKKKNNYENSILFLNTSKLSAYIKFGNISVREVYFEIKNNTFRDQLIWREFFYYIIYYNPNILSKSENFNSKWNKFKWENNKENFDAWCNAKTGFPVIDACMTELNVTGYMHNRGRLITSNFLHRILGIDWRYGEKYFAQKLIDYDPIINNQNWQWSASVGVDTKPFFQRILNPNLQSKKYDPKANYIKKWLPHLSNISDKELHNWEKYYYYYNLAKIKYYKPIVNYSTQKEKSIEMYRHALIT